MTGRTAIATAHWRRLDHEGTDRCTLSRLDQGWMLVGQADWREDGVETRLSYDVRCGPDWATLSADVAGVVAGRDVALRLHRGSAGWALNDKLQPDSVDCIDLDLCFTPATNLIPLRRLTLPQDESVAVRAAWLVPALDAIRPIDQTYARQGADRFLYSSPGFQTELTVCDCGFVTRYGDIWDGWVDD